MEPFELLMDIQGQHFVGYLHSDRLTNATSSKRGTGISRRVQGQTWVRRN